MKKTPYFQASTPPARPGLYEFKAWPFPHPVSRVWSGKRWSGSVLPGDRWRGIQRKDGER